MSVLRVMGTETEYGISVPGQPGANAMVTSSQIVNAYQAATAAKARLARLGPGVRAVRRLIAAGTTPGEGA